MTAESINRRKFIRTTGVAAEAISMVPNLAYSENSFDPKGMPKSASSLDAAGLSRWCAAGMRCSDPAEPAN